MGINHEAHEEHIFSFFVLFVSFVVHFLRSRLCRPKPRERTLLACLVSGSSSLKGKLHARRRACPGFSSGVDYVVPDDALKAMKILTSALLRACSVSSNDLLNEDGHARMRALPGSSEESSMSSRTTREKR